MTYIVAIKSAAGKYVQVGESSSYREPIAEMVEHLNGTTVIAGGLKYFVKEIEDEGQPDARPAMAARIRRLRSRKPRIVTVSLPVADQE